MKALRAITTAITLITASCLIAPACAAESPRQDGRIAKLIAKSDGRTPETAIKVRSVSEEYKVLSALGLQPQQQALVIDKKAYDKIETVDPRTGETRTVWFDISDFFGQGF